MRNGRDVQDEDGLFPIEDVGHLELEKVGGSFRDECSLSFGRSGLDGLEHDLEVFCGRKSIDNLRNWAVWKVFLAISSARVMFRSMV